MRKPKNIKYLELSYIDRLKLERIKAIKIGLSLGMTITGFIILITTIIEMR